MDRALISLNVQNSITIALIAIFGWLAMGTIWQVAKKYVPQIGSNGSTSNDGGY